MNPKVLTRRKALKTAGVVAGALAALSSGATQRAFATPHHSMAKSPFIFCLNTATIRGQKLGIEKEIDVAAKAGYDAIEPWVDGIEAYVKGGGKLKDLKKRIKDRGLTVEGAIGFPEWIVDDAGRRAKGLERAKFELDMVSQIGAKRLAAPPAGATDLPRLGLLPAAERYRVLLDLAKNFGVIPQLELWGFSKNLNRLGECVCVAMETSHLDACVLPDIYHVYKGGSDYHGLRWLGRDVVQMLHVNDYPAKPGREEINDGHRLMPGDGVAPVVEVLNLLRAAGGQKVLSVEIFSEQHWKLDALVVAKEGLTKMRAVARQSRGS